VRDDGTFNDREDGGGRRTGPRRAAVSVSAGSGGGLEAHADVRIAIPRGNASRYTAVGQAFVSNVDGDLRVDVAART